MSESTTWQPEQALAQGRFVLVKRLGRGGMGEVWLARDERLREPVALKFLPPEIRGDAGALDDLRRETARSHRLSHPNIVRIHDLYEDPDGTAFIVMEYIDGATLTALRLQQSSRVLAWNYLRPLVGQLCAALEYAHGEKVIHRDLKPANLMVDSRGRLKLADFGIAAVVSDSMSRVSVKHLTSGTLPYMSPQQLTGQRPQAADDIYALGATLYELLTGSLPFHSGDITHQIMREPPQPMKERLAALGMQSEIPPEADSLIMACLAKEPGQRPQSARAVAERVGLELEAKPSAESLAAALFAQAPTTTITVKIQCSCGQKYSFDVAPLNGGMPNAVACPACGADGTAAANEIIARAMPGQPPAPSATLPVAAFAPPLEEPPPPKAVKAPLRKRVSRGLKIRASIAAALVLSVAAAYYWWQYGATVPKVTTQIDPSFPNTPAELDKWFQEAPQGQNAAEFYQQAVEACQITVADYTSVNLPMIGQAQMPSLGKPLTAAMETAISNLFQRFQPALPFLDKANECTQSRYAMNLSKIHYGMELPYPWKVIQLNRMTVLFSLRKTGPQIQPGPLDWLLTSLKVAQSLKSEPLETPQLDRLFCLTNSLSGLEQLLNRASFPATALEQLQGYLESAEREEAGGESFTRAYAGERVAGLAFLVSGLSPSEIMAGEVNLVTDASGHFYGTPVRDTNGFWEELYLRKSLNRNLKAQRAFYEETLNHAIALRQQPLPDRLKIDAYLHERAKEAQSNDFKLCIMLMPALGRMTTKEATGLAGLRLALAAVALERFRAGNSGRYPETLGELTPLFLKERPMDPFDGQPLRYSRISDGFEVFSVGPDSKHFIFFKVIKPPPLAPAAAPPRPAGPARP